MVRAPSLPAGKKKRKRERKKKKEEGGKERIRRGGIGSKPRNSPEIPFSGE